MRELALNLIRILVQESRVHAASCSHLGQPFYGWLRSLVPFLQPVSTGLGHRLSEVFMGSSPEVKPVETGSQGLDEMPLDQP